MTTILIPVSPGELFDKLAILELKLQHLADDRQLAHVRVEKELLDQALLSVHIDLAALAHQREALLAVNADLWAIEEDIRRFEARQDFGPAFIALARAVYTLNDTRARLKREINLALGSAIVEQKSHLGAANASERRPQNS